MIKRIVLVVVLVAVAAFLVCSEGHSASPAPENKAGTSKTLNVYYFHNTFRCATCLKIEEQAKKAIEAAFAEDLAAGRMVWLSVNMEEAPNKHYREEYNIEMPSLIVAETQDGKQTHWKNLDKVWDLVRQEEDFAKYVKDEIKAYQGQ